MTETMIERMARAMAAEYYAPVAYSLKEDRDFGAGEWPKFVSIARAALEAIREPDAAMIRAASESDADDGEGGMFGPMCDLLGFSGENKTRLVVAEALRKSVDAILSQSQEEQP